LGTPTINATDGQYIIYSLNTQNNLYEFQGISSEMDLTTYGQLLLSDYFTSRFTTKWTKTTNNTTYGLTPYINDDRSSSFDTLPIYGPQPPHKKDEKN
jgi:hypothetical protein